MTDTSPMNAADAGILEPAGDLTVRCLGYGAMRITGDGIWGEPPDRDGAKATLRRAVEVGFNFLDTADSYGPEVSETLIAEALPIPGRPRHRHQGRSGTQLARALAHDVTHLAFVLELGERPDRVLERHVGRWNSASSGGPAGDTDGRSVRAAAAGVHAVRPDSRSRGFPVVRAIADRRGATPRQVVLAWLLARSPAILPIPGTSSVVHLERNVAAAGVELVPEDSAAITERQATT